MLGWRITATSRNHYNNNRADVVVVYVYTNLLHTNHIRVMGQADLINLSLNLGNQKKL